MMGIFVSYRVKVKLVVSLGGYVKPLFLCFSSFTFFSELTIHASNQPKLSLVVFTL